MIFSIIIPIFNENLKDFKRLLNSIADNNFKDYEVIIIDDTKYINSNKNFFKKLSDKFNFSYTNNKIKLGLSMSCNLGIQLSKGSYCIFLNCDNYIKNDFFSYANKKIKLEKLDILMTFNKVLNNKNIFGQFVESQSKKNLINGNRINKLINFNFISYTEGFIVKKNILIKSGAFYDHKLNYFKAGEDFILAAELRKILNIKSSIDFHLTVKHIIPDTVTSFFHNRYIRGYGTPQINYYYLKKSLLECNFFFLAKNTIKIINLVFFIFFLKNCWSNYSKYVDKRYLTFSKFILLQIFEDLTIIYGEIVSLFKINLLYRDRKLININDLNHIK